MMAHELTSTVFPQKDKLIRNMMGILTEAQVGNPLPFPVCGFSSDDWVRAFLDAHSSIPFDDLGPYHESWGMTLAAFPEQGTTEAGGVRALSQQLEKDWLAAPGTQTKTGKDNLPLLTGLIEKDPHAACTEAPKMAGRLRPQAFEPLAGLMSDD